MQEIQIKSLENIVILHCQHKAEERGVYGQLCRTAKELLPRNNSGFTWNARLIIRVEASMIVVQNLFRKEQGFDRQGFYMRRHDSRCGILLITHIFSVLCIFCAAFAEEPVPTQGKLLSSSLEAGNAVPIEESDSSTPRSLIIDAAKPELSPYKPSSWSDKIVVSKKTGTTTDDTPLYPTDTLYVDWAALNSGGPTDARFYSALYVDDVLKQSWYTDPPLKTNYYAYVLDYSIGSLPAGTHTVKIVVDSLNNISEGNENNNSYTKTIQINEPGGALSPSHDRDGDGVPDIVDPLPLDPDKSSLVPFDEVEFNNNLAQANYISSNLPLVIRGTIAKGANYYLDIDYFRFNAKAGDRISVLAYRGTTNDTSTSISFQNLPFTPRVSLINSSGGTLAGYDIKGIGLPAGISVQIPSDGYYYVQISDTSITASDYSYPYVLLVFKDYDGDGVSDDLETALNMNTKSADQDSDGLGDYSEVLSFSLKTDGIKKPNNPSSSVWWDTDKDKKVNWLDKDSDGDGIEDGIEGVADYDADRLPAFLDLNSNGNKVKDADEAGKSLNHPDDLDADGIPDYQDLDMDGDGIANNSDPSPSILSIPTISTGLVIYNVAAELDADTQLWGVLVPGKLAVVYGKGINKSTKVMVPVLGGAVTVKPKSVGKDFLKFAVPERAIDGLLFLTLNKQRSEGYPVTVKNPDSDPILTSLSSTSVMPYDSLTLYGKNLSEDLVSIVFENSKGAVSVSQKAALDSVQVTVPLEASGGKVRVEVGTRKSNSLDLAVNRLVTVTVALPPSLKIPAKDISIIANGERFVLGSGYTVQVPSLNKDLAFLNCFVQLGSDDYALLFEGVVLPDKNTITLSSLSTAAKMVFFGLGYSVTLPKDKWETVVTTLEKVPKVVALSDYINKLLGNDLEALSKFTDKTLVSKLQEAIVAGSKAVAPILKTLMTMREMPEIEFFGLEPIITPKKEQYGVGLAVKDPADITVRNGTKLFASIEVRANDKKKTLIQKHACHMFDTAILGPSGWIGYFTSYFQSSKDYGVKGRDSHFEIITSGVKPPNPSGTKSSKHTELILKLNLEGIVYPVIDKFLIGPLFNQSIDNEAYLALIKHVVGMRSLNRMVAEIINSPSDTVNIVYNIVIMQFITALKSCNFPPNPATPCYLLCEAIAKTLFKGAMSFDAVAKIVASSVGKQVGAALIPVYGQIRTALSTADKLSVVGNVAASIYDLANTPGQIDFDVDFPLEITQVKPLCLSKTDTVNQFITIVGKGIHPVKDDDGYDILPEVYIGNEKGWVHNWGDGEGDLQEIYVSFGQVSLPDGDYPIKVVHQGQEAISEDKVRVFEKGAVLDLIEPSKGGAGDTVVLYGCGLCCNPAPCVCNPQVFFTADGGKTVQAAGIRSLGETELTAIVPEKAVTGDVYVQVGTEKSNSLLFTVEQSQVVITYGDCGAATDDTFDLFVDGELKSSMSAPSTPFPVYLNLSPGKHEVRLVGVTAPDAIGTYCISFSSNVQVVSGPPLSGDDLTAGVVKTWVIEVNSAGGKLGLEPDDIEGLILWDLSG